MIQKNINTPNQVAQFPDFPEGSGFISERNWGLLLPLQPLDSKEQLTVIASRIKSQFFSVWPRINAIFSVKAEVSE